MRGRALALGGCMLAASVLLFGGIAAGEPPAPAEMSVTPSQQDFGSQCIGTSSSRSFTIKNSATSSDADQLSIDSISQTDPKVASFTPQNVTPPGPIDPGDTASFAVTFTPSVHGTREVDYRIDPKNDGLSSRIVNAVGTGLDRRLTSDRSTVSFGDQRVGTRSPNQTVIVRNPGADTVLVSAAKKLGPHDGDFRVTAPAQPFSIAPGNFVSVTMAFQPKAAGLRAAALEFTSNACGKPKLKVSIVGTGVVPKVALDPNPIDVGAAAKGVQGPPTAVTVTNGGGAPLKISAVQVLGTDAADFVLSGLPTMPMTLPPGESFIFSVRMTPTAEGLRIAKISVLSDDPVAPSYSVDLRGTGGKATASPSASATASATPTRGPSPKDTTSTEPRALGVAPNDSLAIVLVVAAVLLAFAGLVVIRRLIRTPDDEE